jgi:glycosyltransferase involved in cell wall biosynthesis
MERSIDTQTRPSPLPFDPSATERLAESTPKVSIVIPAYNVAQFIAETLESVFAQTFTNYEVIVINDGSPDTEELERAIAPYYEGIRYLKQENRGASAARNAGLREAKGELVAFLDADDVWSSNYLAEQLKFMQDQKSDLVCANALIFGQGPDTGRSYMDSVMMGDAPATDHVTFLELVNSERSLITSGVLARRSLILEAGLFDERLRNAQDFDLWLRLARRGARLTYQRKILLRYRCREGSLTGDAINSHRRELRVFDKIESEYPFSKNERTKVLAVIQRRRALLEYELGKLYLLPGDFAAARESFAAASRNGGGWKPLLALWLTRVTPQLMRAIYVRRTNGN